MGSSFDDFMPVLNMAMKMKEKMLAKGLTRAQAPCTVCKAEGKDPPGMVQGRIYPGRSPSGKCIAIKCTTCGATMME